MVDELHPSHRTRISMGASSYDEICVLCGATDGLGTWGKLVYPCRGPLEKRVEYDQRQAIIMEELKAVQQIPELEPVDLIQIVPTHKWGGCIAVVDEVKSWGCQCYVSIPTNDGNPAGRAYIRLNTGEFERIGAKAIFVPEGA